MKFLIAFIIAGTSMIAYNKHNVYIHRDEHVMIPSMIVNENKIEPLKVPHSRCAPNESSVTTVYSIEEYFQFCVNQRQWHKIVN